MTHYESHQQATQKDNYVLDAISAFDTQLFLSRVQEKNVSMCGVAPVAILLETLKAIGATNATLIKYTTSGDVTKNFDEVVGYAEDHRPVRL